ncbi:MAG: DUF4395 domain-containing protein [Paludibacter sp.]|nr:DUF4395 domain-containing protein [Paludibacter sp.]
MKQFGETVKGYNIPVLNEREIRAAAGVLFLFVFISIQHVIYTGNFILLKFFVLIFLVDFFIRVFISPKYAPTLIIGRMIVSRQTPEYVGAAQKKFAWIIGLALAVTMFVLLLVMNSTSPITGIICLVCQIFLFFESALGICLGCSFYNLFYKEKAQHCPGEVCERKDKQAIQKVSWLQVVIVIAFISMAIAIFIFSKDTLSLNPVNLF